VKEMGFEQALIYLEQGKRIKRKHWQGYWKIEDFKVNTSHYKDGIMILAFLANGEVAPAQAYQQDLLAKDWEVVE
jgi:hypothetical protein